MRPRADAGDESIASFLGRHFGRGGGRAHRRAAAGRHPRRRPRPAVDALRVSALRGDGAEARKPDPRDVEGAATRRGAPPPSCPSRAGCRSWSDALAARVRPSAQRRPAGARGAAAWRPGWEIESAAGADGRGQGARPRRARAGGRAAARPASIAGLAGALGAFRSVSTAVVYLGYRRADVAHPLDGYGVVIPRGEGLRASAFGFVSTKFPGRAPEGHVLLRVFLGGAREPDVLDDDDDALVDRACARSARPCWACAARRCWRGSSAGRRRRRRWRSDTPRAWPGSTPWSTRSRALRHRGRAARDRDPGHGRGRRAPGPPRRGVDRGTSVSWGCCVAPPDPPPSRRK